MNTANELPLPRTAAVILDGLQQGLHSGAQIYVSRDGRVIADVAVGEACPGQPMTRDSIMMWLSAGKPLTAVAILQLCERGLLELDAPVARWIPEFAAGGKHNIHIRHLLTHTGGFRNIASGWPQATWDDILARICSSPLEQDWVIGQTAGYHISSSWYVLGELIQRVTGVPFTDYLRERICIPLNMYGTWNGMTAAVHAQLRKSIASMEQQHKGVTEQLPWHDEQHCCRPSPGGNTRGPIRELGRFYECLLHGGSLEEAQILSDGMTSEMTRRQRIDTFDQTLQHTVDFGLGVIINSHHHGPQTVPYGYGPGASPEAFGHGGSQCSIGFADPTHGLVVAYATNRRIGEPRHQRRNRAIVTAIYEDLEIPE